MNIFFTLTCCVLQDVLQVGHILDGAEVSEPAAQTGLPIRTIHAAKVLAGSNAQARLKLTPLAPLRPRILHFNRK